MYVAYLSLYEYSCNTCAQARVSVQSMPLRLLLFHLLHLILFFFLLPLLFNSLITFY